MFFDLRLLRKDFTARTAAGHVYFSHMQVEIRSPFPSESVAAGHAKFQAACICMLQDARCTWPHDARCKMHMAYASNQPTSSPIHKLKFGFYPREGRYAVRRTST